MPGLVRPADLEALQRRLAGTTRERMLRELAKALEVLTAQQPLVLVLEDLHWSDPSTLDLLAVLARRREPARLLLLGTYRSPEVRHRAHPLAAVLHELHLHSKASGGRRSNCSPGCTTGSLRGLTPLTFRRPERYSIRSDEGE
jgi:hypothetical protein